MSTTQQLSSPKQMQQNASNCSVEKNSIQPTGQKQLSLNNLRAKQIEALELLLQGQTDPQVAAVVGVDRTTVYRWKQNPRFAAELNSHRQLLLEQSGTRLQAMIGPALDILQRQMTGDDPKIALRAASTLLRLATPSRLNMPGSQSHPDQLDENQDEDDDFARELDAYINGPLPNEPGHPNYHPPTERSK